MTSPNQTPPAGWYPDPEAPARLRYWDGAVWSDSVPAPGAVAGEVGYGDYGEWFGETFTVAVERVLPALVMLFVLPGVAFTAVMLLVRSFVADLGYDNVTDELVGFEPGILLLLIVVAVLAAFVSAAGYLGAHADLYAAHAGRPQPILDSLGDGVRSLPRALLWFIWLALLALIPGVVLIGFPVLLGAVVSPGYLALLVLTVPLLMIGGFYAAVRLSFVVTAMAVGPRGIDPISDSWRLTQGRWVATLVRLILLWGVGYVMNSALQGGLSLYAVRAVPGNLESEDEGGELLLDGVPLDELDFVDFEVFLPAAWVFVVFALTYAFGQAVSQAIQISGTAALYRRAQHPAD